MSRHAATNHILAAGTWVLCLHSLLQGDISLAHQRQYSLTAEKALIAQLLHCKQHTLLESSLATLFGLL
jgi:hypothetical protein